MQSFDDAYANAAYIPNADRFVPQWKNAALIFREKLNKEEHADCDIAHGPTQRQKFEVFAPVSRSEDVFIFIHGRYWLRFDKSYWFHLVTGALQRGWHLAIPSYVLCPDVRISKISQQIAKAVTEIAKRITKRLLWLDILPAATLRRVWRLGIFDRQRPWTGSAM